MSKSLAKNPSAKVAVSRSICLAADSSRPRMIPIHGKSTMGNKAVADSGIASVIHQIAISRIIAAMRVTAGLPGSKSTNKSINTNTSGPSQRPILLRVGTTIEFAVTGSVALIINPFERLIPCLQMLLENFFEKIR